MKKSLPSRRAALGTLALGTLALGELRAAAEPKRILVCVGPSQHPPGTHEVAAGGRLLKSCLEAVGQRADVITEWPSDSKALADVASVVFIGDMFPPEVMPKRDKIMADLTAMMKRGCGIACIHYATGLEAKHVAADGDHPLLHWMGGYFATRCNHHKSVAKVFREATIEPAAKGAHPVMSGWKPFTLHDEPYINNYFGKDGPAKNVTVIATAKLPPEDPKVQTVAWAVERPDGGRGFGVVMPHFYRNWKIDDLRTLILNGIVWSARQDVTKGVRVKLPDIAEFKPDAVEPPEKKPKR